MESAIDGWLSMTEFYFLFGTLCLAAAGLIVLWSRVKTKKVMDRIDRMLTCAMQGECTETSFDESRLSALESEFAQYLTSSALSHSNLLQEKDTIKQLIADISHQTKTPLANILLYTELLAEEELPQTAQDNVAALHLQAEKLQFLIDSLVKLSRLENGILSLSPKKQRLSPMLEAAVLQFSPRAQSKGLNLILEKTAAEAVFDRKWTAEALCNLLDNAIKYTDQGEIRISVQCYELFVRINVADSGIGIKEEDQAKIFSRFYRAPEVSDQEGVGIGLYLTRQILSQEGGYLKVCSQPGKGSVFSAFLPASV